MNAPQAETSADRTLVARLLERLNDSGVDADHLQRLVEDGGPRWWRVVSAILHHESGQEENIVKYGEVSPQADPKVLQSMLREAGLDSEAVDYYSTPARFELLLWCIEGDSWHRAALVMRYGIGMTHRNYELDEISRALGRSELMVLSVLGSKGLSALRSAQRCAELLSSEPIGANHELDQLGLTPTVKNVLLRAGITKIEQLCGMTEQDVRTTVHESERLRIGSKRMQELVDALAAKGWALKS
jgi:hypothetical protein